MRWVSITLALAVGAVTGFIILKLIDILTAALNQAIQGIT